MAKGLILVGQFVCWKRIDKETGTRYRCSITDGSNSYTVTVKEQPEFQLGDDVAAVVSTNAFNDRVYLSADKLTAAKL